MAESISDRAANGDDPDADELFPMGSIDGGEKTLKNLIPPGATVQSTVSLSKAEVPGGGKLFDPEAEGVLLVTFKAGKYEQVPLHAEGKVASWKVRQTLDVVHIERVEGDAGDIEAAFEVLLDGDAAAAGRVLDKLKQRATKAMATA